jgi:hypothetical protein
VGALAAGGILGGLSSDTNSRTEDRTDSKPSVKTIPKTERKCDKCPPDLGNPEEKRHGANWAAYEYQARVTGRPYDTEYCLWSQEWVWATIYFDGFQVEECLLQEAKGKYDQFIDKQGKPKRWFTGFQAMTRELERQSEAVNANPPARLKWYFQTPKTRSLMLSRLLLARVESVYLP